MADETPVVFLAFANAKRAEQNRAKARAEGHASQNCEQSDALGWLLSTQEEEKKRKRTRIAKLRAVGCSGLATIYTTSSPWINLGSG
jgi:hypothetical protein